MVSGLHPDFLCQRPSLSDPLLPLVQMHPGGNLFGLLFSYRLMTTPTSVDHGHLSSLGPTSCGRDGVMGT